MGFLMVLLSVAILVVGWITCTVMATQKGSETNLRITVAVAVIAVIMVWVFYFNWSSSPEREAEQVAKDCGNTSMAYVMSQNFVKQRLKSPSSAQFPSTVDRDVVIRPIAGCNFEVSAYVDAKNGFGAPLRSYYSAKMSYDRASKMWRAVELTLN